MSRSQGLFCEDKYLLYKINPGANPAAKIVLFLSGISISIKNAVKTVVFTAFLLHVKEVDLV